METLIADPVEPYAESSVRFRPVSTSDREVLLSMCAAYRAADRQPLAAELVRAAVDAALAGDHPVRLFMIELLEESEAPGERAAMLVGYLALTLGFSIEAGGLDAFVDELFIEPSVQHRGIGRIALAFAEQQCRELGVQRMCLAVERANERAQRIYERVGYRTFDRHLMSKRIAG